MQDSYTLCRDCRMFSGTCAGTVLCVYDIFIDTESHPARLGTFDVDKTQRFDGAHSVLCDTGVCACVVLTHALDHQLALAIRVVIMN